MKKKRKGKFAQITVFIIVAVILVVAGGIAYFITKQSSDSSLDKDFFLQQDVKVKVTNILNLIKDCEDLSADNSIIRIGLQGGYNVYSETYLDFGWMFIPYYYIEGKTYLPDKNKIEKELADNFDSKFQHCINLIDTEDFYLITKSFKTTAEVSKGIVKFNIDMPFTIGKDGKEANYDLKGEPFVKNYKFYEMYEIAKYITDSHNQNPPSLCMDCLIEMANEKQLFLDFVTIEKDTKLVVISENINNGTDISDFIYQFAEKYKAEEKTTAPKSPENA